MIFMQIFYFAKAVSTNSYISTFFYFTYNQQFGTLYLTVQAIYIYVFCFCMNKDNGFAVQSIWSVFHLPVKYKNMLSQTMK